MSKKIVNKSQNDKYTKRKEVLTSFFLNSGYEPATLKQIISLFGIPKDDLTQLHQILNNLMQSGIIALDENDRYVVINDEELIKCRFDVKGYKYGFGRGENGEDIYIETKNAQGAMDQDEILVKVIGEDGKNKEGKVVRILKRNTTTVIGKFEKSKNFGFVVPLDSHQKDIYISKKNAQKYKAGQVVKVEIIKYPTKTTKPEGRIIQIIGNIEDSHIDVKSMYAAYGLNEMENFNEAVKEQVKRIPDHVEEGERKNRIDRTGERAYTIDAADAKDLDDAVYVKKCEDGTYMLSVYIADVSHYVVEDSALDKEAIERGTSIYIPGKVIPMLPKELSNGICSLNAGVDRLALGVDINISKDGKIISSDIFKAVIRVTKKMSYDKVYKVINNLEDDELKEEYGEYKEDLKLMDELAHILNSKRMKEGCINFEIPEMHVVLDENEDVVNIEPYPKTFANQIIEEFMLITNMVVAEKFYFLEMPFIYRIHEKPDEEKIRELNGILENYNLRIKGIKDLHPKAISDILNSLSEENKAVISTFTLRSLKLAKYSNECLGHFGLNAKYYCHFTSPIRRYPDLFIHRIISKCIKNNYVLKSNVIERHIFQSEKYALSSSEQEKKATKIERDFNTLYSVLYMQDKLGEEFEATISSVTSFGMFVKLENTIEGFVSFSDIGEDEYECDTKNSMIIGKKNKEKLKIGDKIKVELIKSDVVSKQIDFKVI